MVSPYFRVFCGQDEMEIQPRGRVGGGVIFLRSLSGTPTEELVKAKSGREWFG